MWRAVAPLVLLLAAGCTKKADSLVVVTVDAVPALTGIALLHTVSMAGDETVTRDVGGDHAPFALGGSDGTKSFGVQLRSSITGSFSIVVEARDGAGNVLGTGQGATTIKLGGSVDLTVTLGTPMVLDGGGLDGAPADLGSTDAAPVPDLLQPVVVQPEPVWVGAGGTATSGSRKLNLNLGGFDTVTTTTAPSGRKLASPFSLQTN